MIWGYVSGIIWILCGVYWIVVQFNDNESTKLGHYIRVPVGYSIKYTQFSWSNAKIIQDDGTEKEAVMLLELVKEAVKE